MQSVTEKWDRKYPNAMKFWSNKWDCMSPIFKFSFDVINGDFTSQKLRAKVQLRGS